MTSGMSAITAPPPPPPSSVGYAAQAVNASKVYGHGESAVYALNDVSIRFSTSVYTAIMGPSGSGKSTLMHCVAGLDRLTSGQVLVGVVQVPALVVKSVFQTAAFAGYPNVSFMVNSIPKGQH